MLALLLLYCVVVFFVQSRFRDGHGVSVGILYAFCDIEYIIGYLLTFLLYGESRNRHTLYKISSIVFLFIYLWVWANACPTMPYEGPFHIIWGLLIFIAEVYYLKSKR